MSVIKWYFYLDSKIVITNMLHVSSVAKFLQLYPSDKKIYFVSQKIGAYHRLKDHVIFLLWTISQKTCAYQCLKDDVIFLLWSVSQKTGT